MKYVIFCLFFWIVLLSLLKANADTILNETDHPKAIGEILLVNNIDPPGSLVQVEHVITVPEGQIVILEERSLHFSCGEETMLCPDTFTVTSHPTLLRIEPMEVEVPERDTGVMFIYERMLM